MSRDPRAGRSSRLVLGAGVLALAVAGCAGCDGEPEAACEGGLLADRLAAAEAGDVVLVGECRVSGAFVVPAGVTLRGEGVGRSFLAGMEGPVVRLESGTPATALEGVTIESSARFGVLAVGSGLAAVRDVDVAATRGIAIAATDVAELELTNVTARGPVTMANAADPIFALVAPAADALPDPPSTCPLAECAMRDSRAVGCPGCGTVEQLCDPVATCGQWVTMTAAYGLVLGGVVETRATDVEIAGFTIAGVVIQDENADGARRPGRVTWMRGAISDHIGAGLVATGAITLGLDTVRIERTVEGARRVPAYGALFADGVEVTTNALRVEDGERFGLVHLGARVEHVGMVAQNNGDAAVWVADSDRVIIRGAGTTFADNEFASVAIYRSSNVTIEDATITGTRERLALIGIDGSTRIGDGIHLAETYSGVRITRVTASNNERAGIIVDLGTEATPDIVFADVEVTATLEATPRGDDPLGAIGGRPDAADNLVPEAPGTGWDTGIVRRGDAPAHDAARTTPVEAIGVAAPDSAPDTSGAVGFVGPCD